MTQLWRTYEEVATYLLGQILAQLQLNKLEGKQFLTGNRSGTKWEIDAKGIREGNGGFVIIEYRRYTTSAQNQERLGGLAYRILDTGASGGIIVTPIGLQAGASKVAAAEGILHIYLHEDSTPQQFCLQFLGKIFVGIHETVCATDSVSATVERACKGCGVRFQVESTESYCPKCS